MFLQRVGNKGIRLGTLFERAAARFPKNLVTLDHTLDVAPELGQRITLAEVSSLVADLASRLWAAGARSGDRVVIYKQHNFDISLLACAVARIGAVPVLLSPKLDGATVAELARRVDRPFLVTDQQKLEDELPSSISELCRQVLLTRGSYGDARPLSSFAGAAEVPAVRMAPDDPTMITHTSGTTGIPKLAVHTGRTFQARYRPQAALARLAGRREPVAIHVSFVHSRMYTAMPIAVLQGHPLIILAHDDPKTVADLFAEVHPGLIEAHPNAFLLWEELADDPRQPLFNVRYFSSTFDAIHPRTVNRLLKATRRLAPRYIQMYGQSEVGPITVRPYSLRRGAEADGRCVGVPFPGMTGLRVVSRDGRPPSPSSPGFIEVRSDGRIVTYLGEDERYQKQLNQGWWRMGDVGYRTKWGCLHLLDREVDLIPGIESTLAVEDTLFARMDDLIEVVIVPGVNDVPTPVVCTRHDKPLDRGVWEQAVQDLPRMAEPVQWRHQDLPQTATTKIKRLELSRRLALDGNGAASG